MKQRRSWYPFKWFQSNHTAIDTLICKHFLECNNLNSSSERKHCLLLAAYMFITVNLMKSWITFMHNLLYHLPKFVFFFLLYPLKHDYDCQECFATSSYERHCGSFSVWQRCTCSAACSSPPPSSCSGLGLLCLRAWRYAPSTNRG